MCSMQLHMPRRALQVYPYGDGPIQTQRTARWCDNVNRSKCPGGMPPLFCVGGGGQATLLVHCSCIPPPTYEVGCNSLTLAGCSVQRHHPRVARPRERCGTTTVGPRVPRTQGKTFGRSHANTCGGSEGMAGGSTGPSRFESCGRGVLVASHRKTDLPEATAGQVRDMPDTRLSLPFQSSNSCDN